MSIETRGAPGRFCNHVIRNLFASMLASRFDLTAHYSYQEEIGRLGLSLYSGGVTLQDPPAAANDTEVLDTIEGVLALRANKYNFCNDNCYFQSRRHSTHLRRWLNDRQPAIRAANPFAARYAQNRDTFIHLRLGDVAAFSPGIEYFCKAIAGSDTGFIGTDSPDHPMVQQLLKERPGLRLFEEPDVVRLLQFASTCQRVVLSHGSFSAVMGYLAFDSIVCYAPYTSTIWCGDMFTQPDWQLIV